MQIYHGCCQSTVSLQYVVRSNSIFGSYLLSHMNYMLLHYDVSLVKLWTLIYQNFTTFGRHRQYMNSWYFSVSLTIYTYTPSNEYVVFIQESTGNSELFRRTMAMLQR